MITNSQKIYLDLYNKISGNEVDDLCDIPEKTLVFLSRLGSKHAAKLLIADDLANKKNIIGIATKYGVKKGLVRSVGRLIKALN